MSRILLRGHKLNYRCPYGAYNISFLGLQRNKYKRYNSARNSFFFMVIFQFKLFPTFSITFKIFYFFRYHFLQYCLFFFFISISKILLCNNNNLNLPILLNLHYLGLVYKALKILILIFILYLIIFQLFKHFYLPIFYKSSRSVSSLT